MGNEYGAIINLTIGLNNAIKNAKEQEQKYLNNPRCKRAEFSTCHFYLGKLAEREGMSPPSLEETERLVRLAW